MGNIPPSSFTVPSQVGNIAISTRSEPLMGYAVTRECGLVFGNSQAYNNRSQGAAAAHLGEAMSMMAAEAQKLGANAVLGVHVEVKEYGRQYAVCQAYGTACIVGPR
mmetsp:Transcript_39985/g.46593  ORF Transcript_39985/g.46593 Transcript_39985/m.46593 type:complete len:107 (+) Transcript_39985:73-393(+)